MSTDPLLRAVARGDPNCPDGAHLARLGALARAAGEPPRADLRQRVLDAIADNEREAADEGAQLDAWLDGRPDPALDRLRAVLALSGTPADVDLTGRVRKALAPRSLRLTPQAAERAGRRWRLVAAIAAAHVAALLLFTTLGDDPPGSGPTLAVAAPRADPAVPTAPTWDRLQRAGGDVLAPRRSELARETARADARLGDTAPAVGRMLAWLIAHQDPATGRIGSGSGERALATQALAALALLGEGAGDQTRLLRARLALGPVAAAVTGGEPLGPAALSAAALALVEGALVTGDPELHLVARAGLTRLHRELPGRPHEGGLAGLAWLAIESAAAAGVETPRGSLEAARNRIARPVPDDASDSGRLGLAAYARIVLGLRAHETTTTQLAALATRAPAADGEGRIDPLGWFLSGLAMHAAGGPAWTAWAEGLRSSIVPRLVAEGAGLARLPAAAVRHAEGDDALSTALAVLALQAPYRYAVPENPAAQ